jgi:hypothetical protein
MYAPAMSLSTRPPSSPAVDAFATALDTLEVASRLAWVPQRAASAHPVPASDIQFDLDRYIPPARVVDGVPVRFGPVHTVFATARLGGTPTLRDQRTFAAALDEIEASYPWQLGGVFVHVAYGLPYFDRLPRGLVALHLPRLLSDTNRFALEEAVPSPTDVHPGNPGVQKLRFHVPVRIETNDLLITLRGDNPEFLADVLAWLGGSGTLAGRPVPSPGLDAGLVFTSSRAMFVQMGLPRKIAMESRTPYAHMLNTRSPMWMGFADHRVDACAPSPVVTFQGGNGIHLTTAYAGDYFDNGSIQHLSHNIQDLRQFYNVDDEGNPADDAAFTEQVQYMFRSTPPATDLVKHEGLAAHLSALQRSSRTPDGRPIHQRLDGAGFDDLDVPDGTHQPKLHFSVFIPTADLFARMRRSQGVHEHESGLERFITSTRRQNFLVPPRRHRAFPLLEVT